MKFFKRLILFVILAIIIIAGIIYLNGKKLYNETLDKLSLSDKIAEIKSIDTYVPLKDVSKYYTDAVIAVEDHRFREHGPVDYIAIIRAIVSNIRAKDLNEGGSTITQQVAKNLYFMDGNNYDVVSRKIAEILISIDLEKEYSKDDVLEFYINTIYFGEGYYGIREASNGYYKKEPKDLNLSEASMLAGIPNAPSVYAPTINPNLAKSRQGKVLSSMVEYGYISQKEADEIIKKNQ